MSARETFFLNHPDPMWIEAPGSGQILDVNPAAERLYGYSRAEFLTLSAADLVAEVPVADEDVADEDGADEDGAPGPIEMPGTGKPQSHRTRGGAIILVDLRAADVEFDGSAARLQVARDISWLAGAATRSLHTADAADVRSASIRLQEQESSLRMVQRLLKIGFWKYDLKLQKLDWSPSLYEIAGITPGQFDGSLQNYVGLLHGDEKAVATSSVRGLDDPSIQLHEFERRLVRPDGSIVYIKGAGEMTRTLAGNVITGVAQDITTERVRERRLRLLGASIERLNDMVMIIELDRQAGSTRSPIVYVNAAFERLTGFTRESVVGQPLSFALSHLSPELGSQELEETLGAGGSLRRELTGEASDGRTVIWEVEVLPITDKSGMATHWVAVSRDITERRRAEQLAAINEDRFRLVSQATDDVVWDWDVTSDTLWWGEAFSRLTGDPAAPETTPFEDWSRRVHADDRDRVVASLRSASRSADAEGWTEEYRFVRDNGEERTMLDRGFIIRNEAGTVTRMVGTMMDITSRRAAEQRARESERLEAVGQLTGGVAHDFNNLLTVILGNADALRERLDDPVQKRMAELIHLAASRGSDLTRRLLAFARRQPLKPQRVCLNERSGSIQALLRGALDARIQVRHQPADEIWKVEVDPGQFDVALLNLAFNARDAMPEGGMLTISTSNVRLRARTIGREEVPAGDYVCVTVSDSGNGMSEDTKRRAFEPFFTTKPPGKGSGLGLSMVYGFARQSNGHVLIVSAPGEGTTVKLFFPRMTKRQTKEEAAQEMVPNGVVRKGGCVLVVEDDPLVREHAERSLKELGFSVLMASSGEEALGALKRQADIRLLFTDIVLGAGMNGAELAAAARQLRPGLSVIYTSGYVPDQYGIESTLEPGAIFLGKPYEQSELTRALSAALNGTAAS